MFVKIFQVSAIKEMGKLGKVVKFFQIRACVCVLCIQQFRERLLEKVHATIPKCLVGGRKKFERMARRAMDVCLRVLNEATKVGSTAWVSGTVYWSSPILPFGTVACTFFPTTFQLKRKVCLRLFNCACLFKMCLFMKQDTLLFAHPNVLFQRSDVAH